MSNTCKHPILYFINYAEWFITNNPGTTFEDVLDQYNLFPFSEELCCPCDSPYILSSSLSDNDVTLLDFLTAFIDRTCCVNYNVSVSKHLEEANTLDDYIKDLLYGLDSEVCCKKDDFTSCVQAFLKRSNDFEVWSNVYLNNPNPINFGIFEFGLINDNTSLCEITQFLSSKSDSFANQVILAILNKGIIIDCLEDVNGIVITSVETYYNTFNIP
jgi:hypothetical protein